MTVGHRSCRRGKRVQITLRNGERFIDKFVDHGSNWIQLEQRGKVLHSDLAKFFIVKGKRT